MISFKDFILNEAFDSKLQEILSNPYTNRYERHTLVKNHLEQNPSIAKGSSRYVYETPDQNILNIDGQNVHTPIVNKHAFYGELDEHTDDNDVGRNKDGSKRLLGQMQNESESSEKFNNFHVLQKQHDGTFKHNPNGILTNVTSFHPEHLHTEMLKAQRLKTGDDYQEFSNITKTEDLPYGLRVGSISSIVKNHFNRIGGQETDIEDETLNKYIRHPFIKSILKMVATTPVTRGDFHVDNLGIWTHPVTGKKQPIILDYGLNKSILNAYNNAHDQKDAYNAKMLAEIDAKHAEQRKFNSPNF